MLISNLYIFVALFAYLYTCSAFIEPVLVGISSVVISAGCLFKECCNDNNIKADIAGLQSALKERLYGQHLVQEIVINALKSHWDPRHKAQKALTLSFHGWPGSGKNYVAKFIQEYLYKYGGKSKFVHHFIGRLHFPRSDKVEQYQNEIREWIKSNITNCARQLFVFDEVDKMPPAVLDVIKPMIDYRDDVEGVDYRQSIFIFLSNTGAELINEHFIEFWNQDGFKREDLKLKDFEKLISLGAFNEEGGFHKSDTIRSNLIDHYVPFLPMEKRHIRLCILDEFRQRGVSYPSESLINEAMDFIEWGPSDLKLFSKTGCKRISQKVGALIAKHGS